MLGARCCLSGDAAEEVKEEFSRPYGYFGSWKDVASEVEVVEAGRKTVKRPNLLSESGPMLLSLKDAVKALGIRCSVVDDLKTVGILSTQRLAAGSTSHVCL
ncbi:hypothetical protein [Corynebacterium flavescens]|uniref:hypothetical protein n=1 Tax=Corynebacterium flavescens TaxID=28028 RepID=UPI003FD53345